MFHVCRLIYRPLSNSTLSFFTGSAPFNALEEFKRDYRCISNDLRNATGGLSSGPLEIDLSLIHI